MHDSCQSVVAGRHFTVAFPLLSLQLRHAYFNGTHLIAKCRRGLHSPSLNTREV